MNKLSAAFILIAVFLFLPEKSNGEVLRFPPNPAIEVDRLNMEETSGEKVTNKQAKKISKKKKRSKKTSAKDKKGLWAKIFSLGAFGIGITSWFFAGIALGALAVVLGVIAIRKIKRDPELRTFGFFAVAGLVFGLIGIIGWTIGQLMVAAN